ncbi:DUF6879 family protein [Saccharopolyspora sp. CA-218241]|uniref:DUF6879 family protein n=1 Tax=Saccharopolyspora sp. CA-218241 TaxID=3240027 RepID=UPI003D954F5B
MSTWVRPGAEFADLLRSFRHRAWRWERQGTYRQPDEQEPWRRWRAGEPDDLAWLRPWLDDVAAAARAGKTFARVRVFQEPPTEYQRWQLDLSPENIAAGEDVRVLVDHQADRLDLPANDFWFFDDEHVALMHFEDQQFAGASVLADPVEVDRYRSWRDTAWHHAIPFPTYVQEHSPRSR